MWSKTELLSESSSIFFIGTYYPSNLLRIWTDCTKEPCNLVLGTCILVNLFWKTLFSWIAAVCKLEWRNLKMTWFQQLRGSRALQKSNFQNKLLPWLLFNGSFQRPLTLAAGSFWPGVQECKAAVFTRAGRTDELDASSDWTSCFCLFNTGLQYCCLTRSLHKVAKAKPCTPQIQGLNLYPPEKSETTVMNATVTYNWAPHSSWCLRTEMKLV